jgi:hypothetical protein
MTNDQNFHAVVSALLWKNQEGNDQTVDGNPFGQTHEDQRTTEGFRFFGRGAYRGSARATHCNACPNASQTGGESRSQRGILIDSTFLRGAGGENG